MARSWRVRGAPALGVVLAWLLPLFWLVAVLGDRPSDGTVVSSPGSLLTGERWQDGVTVRETYGGTTLLAGDLIEAVGGADAPAMLEGTARGPAVRVGSSLRYRVLRSSDPLTIRQTVDVPVAAHPVLAVARRHPGRVVVAVVLLAAGSVLVLRLPRAAVAWATLLSGSAAAAGLASVPVGVQAVDLASPILLAPAIAGEAALVLGLGAGVAAAWSFPCPPPDRGVPRRSAAVRVALAMVPLLAAAAWLVLWGRQSRSALLQAALGLSVPAAAVTVAIVGAALVTGFRRARSPQESVAVRLVLLALVSAGAARAVLIDVPRLLRGDPLVPADLLALVLVPMVAACWVAATLGYRLLEIDGALRRGLLQVVLASVVTALFLAAAGAVGVASTTSLRTLVTGGALALVCVPVALVVRRSLSRLVYGDRAFPYRVVAELRRLDLAAADDALRETLEV